MVQLMPPVAFSVTQPPELVTFLVKQCAGLTQPSIARLEIATVFSRALASGSWRARGLLTSKCRPLPVIVQEATILRIVPIRFDERPERPTSSETGRRSVFMGALHPDVFQCMRDGLCLWHSRSGRALSGNLPRFGTRKDSHIGCAYLVLQANSRRCEIRFLRSRFRGY